MESRNLLLTGWRTISSYSSSKSTATLGVLGGSLLIYYLHSKILAQASEKWNLQNEFIIVTGGSSGIGSHIVEELALRKARVLILDIQTPTFELPENVTFFQTDITSATEIAKVGLLIRESYGDPSVLVNNAGVFKHGTILEESEQDMRQTFEVNIIAHFLLLKEFLPAMVRKNRGHVVTMASLASFLGIGGMADYCCTKASALALHGSLKQELKYGYNAPSVQTRSVTFQNLCIIILMVSSIIHPAWVDTPMIKGFTKYPAIFNHQTMSPNLVSQKVVEQIISGKSGNIILPKMLSIASVLSIFPLWLQEVIQSSFSNIACQIWKVHTESQVTEI